MEWISFVVVAVILLKVLNRGGDWFDFLDSTSRYENSLTGFKFNAFFLFLCLLAAGVVFWFLSQVPKPAITPTAIHRPTAADIPDSHKGGGSSHGKK
ncbi:MAG: hypothetical protein K2Y22_15905 [Candidatus Obscuribacterales bacterium]|nr:hypothetical protein [Candidatus Obscuribacterales bacterium]